MRALSIAQARHEAALPPGYFDGDDPVDTMLAADPAFALTGANIDEGLGDLDGNVHRIAADLLANYIEAEGKPWEARAGLEFVRYYAAEIKKLFRQQAEQKHAELTEDYA